MDHDVYIAGECGATVVDTDEADPMTELNEEAFDGEELISERVHALARSGLPLLQT